MKKHILFITTALACSIMTFSSFAGEWKLDEKGYWYQNDDGNYSVNSWQEINGKQYYFDANGYMLSNTITPDGYTVGADGAWIEDPYALNMDENETSQIDKPVFNTYMSDSASSNTTKVTALIENMGDSDLIIYSTGLSLTNKSFSRYDRDATLSVSTDKGRNWTSLNSITLKPGEIYYLGFDVVGNPIVSGISTRVTMYMEYKNVGFIASASPSEEPDQHYPMSFLELFPDGRLTLDIFRQ